MGGYLKLSGTVDEQAKGSVGAIPLAEREQETTSLGLAERGVERYGDGEDRVQGNPRTEQRMGVPRPAESREREAWEPARVPIVGTVNGFPIRTSVFPRGDGTHFMMVNKAIRDGADVCLCDRVTAPRAVTIPADLRKALARSKKAKAAFEHLSYTHRKEFVAWIEGAKRPETRARRIEAAVARLTRGRKTPRAM